MKLTKTKNGKDCDVINVALLDKGEKDTDAIVGKSLGTSLVIAQPSDTNDYELRVFNKNGLETYLCVNTACVAAKVIYTHTKKKSITLKTPISTFTVKLSGLRAGTATIDMGIPIIRHPIPIKINHISFQVIPVELRGRHAVVFFDDDPVYLLKDFDDVMKKISTLEDSPEPANVEIVYTSTSLSNEEQRMAVWTWESQRGEPASNGSGNCASVVAGLLTGKTNTLSIHVKSSVGEYDASWDYDNHCYITAHPKIV